MDRKMPSAIQPIYRKRGAIRTSLLELLKELTSITQDDALVLAVFRHIFNSHRVRVSRTLAPVKLVANSSSRPHRVRFSASKAWA